jgi:23S rRNA (pseudouridine1915-N3)-methyltransferase
LRIRILCVGKLKDGPERVLVDDYLARARKTGQPLGYRAVDEVEVEAGGGRDREGARLLTKHEAASPGGVLIRLDERGEVWPSIDLSKRLAKWRDAGETIDFAIGGADGHAPDVAAKARATLGFGAQTWPHRLVRVMLAEQIYRALSIEAGTPYHRE